MRASAATGTAMGLHPLLTNRNVECQVFTVHLSKCGWQQQLRCQTDHTVATNLHYACPPWATLHSACSKSLLQGMPQQTVAPSQASSTSHDGCSASSSHRAKFSLRKPSGTSVASLAMFCSGFHAGITINLRKPSWPLASGGAFSRS